VSVDTRTKGRRLDGYTSRRIDGREVLLDPDLLKLPVKLTITTGGLFGRKLTAAVDGLDGAACPIQLIRHGLRYKTAEPTPLSGGHRHSATQKTPPVPWLDTAGGLGFTTSRLRWPPGR
jgi:hypothetical protein